MVERADTGMRLINVRKDYGKVAVIHGVDLHIDEGDFVVFVGPSGCGKSTLLRMIAGLEEVTDGSIEIGGVDVTDVDPSRRGIAMVFQSYALYPHMSVRDNLGFGLSMANVPKDEIARNVAEAAHILKLDALLDRRPGQLSGGQRQRVAIGRAIVRKPKVFLFDEPLSNLDAELRVTMRIEIARLHRELGNTMVYVTHDQTEAMTLADKIVVLRDGRIEQVGTPRQVYEDPANTFVAGFIGSPRMNLLKASTDGKRLKVGQDEIALASPIEERDEVVVGLRPEHLTIAEKGPTTIGATIDFSEYLGGIQYLYCQLDDGQSIVAEQREGNVVTPGTRVNFSWKPEKLRLFSSVGERIRA